MRRNSSSGQVQIKNNFTLMNKRLLIFLKIGMTILLVTIGLQKVMGQPGYTDVAQSVGINHVCQHGIFTDSIGDCTRDYIGSSGAAWFDYNNDGHQDLFISGGLTFKQGLFHNNGNGTFTDVTNVSGWECSIPR